MTGLNPQTDTILSLSCYITDSTLTVLDATGYHATILTPASTLSSMSAWCIETHTRSGLVAQCQSTSQSIPAPTAAADLLSYIRRFVPQPGVALLAGNTVHMDRRFLAMEPWSAVDAYLHYRILDVSAIKEAVRRWCKDEVLERVPMKQGRHEADADVKESIEEARFYMGLLRRV